jgi:hypothetical protein
MISSMPGSRASFVESPVVAQPLTPSIPIPPPKRVLYAQTASGTADFNDVKTALQGSTEAFSRVFRIVNIRGNAAQFAGQSGTFQGQIPILSSIPMKGAWVGEMYLDGGVL